MFFVISIPITFFLSVGDQRLPEIFIDTQVHGVQLVFLVCLCVALSWLHSSLRGDEDEVTCIKCTHVRNRRLSCGLFLFCFVGIDVETCNNNNN